MTIKKKKILVTGLVLILLLGLGYYLNKTGYLKKSADTTTTLQTAKRAGQEKIRKLNAETLSFNYSYQKDGSEATSNKLKDKLTERKTALEYLAKNDPETFLSIFTPEDIKTNIPSKYKELVEEDIEAVGEITVNITKDSQTKLFNKTYTININNTDNNLYFAGEDPNYTGGSRLKIKGKRIGILIATSFSTPSENYSVELISTDQIAMANSGVAGTDKAVLAAKSSQPVYVAPTPTPTTAPTNPKQAIILVSFKDTSDFKKLDKSVTTSIADQNGAIWQENSLGKTSINTDVYGPYTMPYLTASCGETTDRALKSTWATRDNIASFAETAAAADGFVASNYNWFHYVFPRVDYSSYPASGCWTWAVSTSSPFTKTWWNGPMDRDTLTWQNGLVLGISRAITSRCIDWFNNPVSIGYWCTGGDTLNTVYDPADLMGVRNTTYHNNIRTKAGVSWILPVKVPTVSTDGRYTITPTETDSSGLQGIRIFKEKVNDTLQRYYYIETRKTYGFDNFAASSPFVNGVSIRIGSDYGQRDHIKLLDMIPTTTTFSDAPLMPGQSFHDPYIGLTVTVVSVSSAEAVVDVKLGPPECVPGIPSLMMRDPMNYLSGTVTTAGTPVHYRGYIKNNDSAACAKRTMILSTPNLPAGWTSSYSANNIELLPGSPYQIVDITITPSVDAAVGAYPTPIKVVEKDNELYGQTLQVTTGVGNPQDVYNLALQTNSQNYSAGSTVTVTANITKDGQVVTGVCPFCKNSPSGNYFTISMVMVKADGTTTPASPQYVDVYLNSSGQFQYKFNVARTDPKGAYKIIANVNYYNWASAVTAFTVN